MKNQRLWICLCVCLMCAGTIFCLINRPFENPFRKESEEWEEEENEEKETGVDKQLAMWWWQKAYPDPTNISGKYQEAWKQQEELKRNTEAIFRQQQPVLTRIQPTTGIVQGITGIQGNRYGSWTAFGPKVFGGRILSIAINRLANAGGSRTLFAGSASGGIWRSYTNGDGATAWHPVPTGTNVLGVSSIAYHPTDTSILLAGTGEVYRIETLTNGTNTYSTNQVSNVGRNVWKCRGTYGIGILRTADAGKTWTNVMPKISSDLFAIQKIRWDPTDATGKRVYACATDGLYRSTDAGLTWTKIWSATFVTDVLVNPVAKAGITLGDEIMVAAGNMTNPTKGIWRTQNGFAAAPTKLTAAPLPATFKGFTNFDYNRGMVAAVISNNSVSDLYTSIDFGTTWTTQSGSNTNFFGSQYWIAHDVAFNPGTAGTSPTQVILGGVDSYKYTLGATTATKIGSNQGATAATMDVDIAPGTQDGPSSYLHADVHDIEYLQGSSTTFYVATDGGIFRSGDNGSTFASCNGGLQVQQFYGPIAQSATTGVMFGGLQDNSVIRYSGTNWRRVRGGDGGPCMFKPGAEATVIVSNDARSVFQSTTSGMTQASFTQPLSNLGQTYGVDERTAFMAPIGVATKNPTRMYVASDNLHISTNSGGTFTKNTPTTMTTPIELTNKTAFAMGVSNLNATPSATNDKLYISMSPLSQQANDNLYYNPPATIRKSTDGGTTFTTKSAGLPDRFITDFAISTTNDENVYITLGGFGTQHVYVTTDGGTSWSPLGSNLPDVPFNTIMIDPTNANILYAGSDFGVYVSPDKGVNWYDFNNGLWDATYAMDLVAAPGGKIRMATHGKGMFESPLFQLSVLPVTIVSFTGTVQDNGNLLKWTTTDESRLSHYIVERSIDGGRFEPIANITARNSTAETAYTCKDAYPPASCYYRLKAVNNDGSYQYAPIIRLNRDGVRTSGLTVMGNPFQSEIHIQLAVNGSGRVQLNLYDMKGALVHREVVSASSGIMNYKIDNLSRYPAGVYQLEAILNRQRWVQRVVKQ